MVQDELNPVENFHEMNEEDFVNMFNRHLFISNKKKELLLNFDTSSRFAFL
jgi:hypothetical protein